MSVYRQPMPHAPGPVPPRPARLRRTAFVVLATVGLHSAFLGAGLQAHRAAERATSVVTVVSFHVEHTDEGTVYRADDGYQERRVRIPQGR